jgi:hypothetical protein
LLCLHSLSHRLHPISEACSLVRDASSAPSRLSGDTWGDCRESLGIWHSPCVFRVGAKTKGSDGYSDLRRISSGQQRGEELPKTGQVPRRNGRSGAQCLSLRGNHWPNRTQSTDIKLIISPGCH